MRDEERGLRHGNAGLAEATWGGAGPARVQASVPSSAERGGFHSPRAVGVHVRASFSLVGTRGVWGHRDRCCRPCLHGLMVWARAALGAVCPAFFTWLVRLLTLPEQASVTGQLLRETPGLTPPGGL